MEQKDWLTIVRWLGYVYAPIALLIIGIFLLVEYQSYKIETESSQLMRSGATLPLSDASTTPILP